MDLHEAFQEYNQDLDEIQEETEVDVERVEDCNECGESVDEGMILFPVKRQVVTVQCGWCGSIYDVWNNELQRGENQ